MLMQPQGVVSRCGPRWGVSLRCNQGVGLRCLVVVSKIVLQILAGNFPVPDVGGHPVYLVIVDGGCMV